MLSRSKWAVTEVPELTKKTNKLGKLSLFLNIFHQQRVNKSFKVIGENSYVIRVTLFQNFNFVASINSLSNLAVIVALSAGSHDCSPSFWRLFDSSLPEVSRPGRIQVRSVNSTSLRFSKYRVQQKFSRLRNTWISHGEMSGE